MASNSNNPFSFSAPFQALVEQASDLFSVVSAAGIFQYLSPACLPMLGYEPAELIGQPYQRLIPSEELELAQRYFAQALQADQLQTCMRGLRKDGTVLWLETKIATLREAATGAVQQLLCISRDVTERRQAEEQLHLLQAAVQVVDKGITITDADLEPPGPRILYVNDAVTHMTGYERADLLGRSPRLLQGPLTDRGLLAAQKAALRQGRPFLGCTVNYRKDGTAFDMEWQIAPIRTQAGQVTHFVAVQRDVTARLRTERLLAEQRAFSQAILDSLGAHIAVLDRTGEILAVNEAWKRFAKRNDANPRTIQGVGLNYLETLRRVVGPDQMDAQRAEAGIAGVLQGTLPEFACEYPCDSQGKRLWFVMHITPLLRASGGAVVSHINVTDRHEAADARNRLIEQLLHAQEEERRTIALDLHDEVGQGLTSLLVGLSALENLDGKKPRQAQTRLLRQTAASCLEHVRQLARGLRPSVLDDLGLEAALKRFAADFVQAHGIALALQLPEPPAPPLPAPLALALYRVAQEALTNVARHAQATQAHLSLLYPPGAVELTVQDNGKSFDHERWARQPAASAHLGLSGMRERATLLGGEFFLEADPRTGTTVRVRVPLRQETHEADSRADRG